MTAWLVYQICVQGRDENVVLATRDPTRDTDTDRKGHKWTWDNRERTAYRAGSLFSDG